jgi:hypothetical protein
MIIEQVRETRLVRGLEVNERQALLLLVGIAVALRILLVATSPTPYGYVWDFYHEGVRVLAREGRLPVAADCWQCYHPPLFYLLGWPLYAAGGLRWLAGLATVSAAIATYYGYRLLRRLGCRGASLAGGTALLLTFPCLFISSYGAEADIVLTAILSAFAYYLTRDWLSDDRSLRASVRLGALAGLAAATKYSGLAAIVSAAILVILRTLTAPRDRKLLLRSISVMVALCAVMGGWKYVDNYRRYGTPMYANGPAVQGFTLSHSASFRDQYELTTFRWRELMQLAGRRAPRGALTDLPIYRSVPTTLHALAWSDMTFFSEPTRHGDPSHPYPRKRIPPALMRMVLILGFVPEALAVLGFAVNLRHRSLWPLAVFCIVSIGAYVWWFLSQPQWGLKTKYVLFLLPAVVVYVMAGLGWLSRHAPRLCTAASVLLAILIVLTHAYLLAFALG